MSRGSVSPLHIVPSRAAKIRRKTWKLLQLAAVPSYRRALSLHVAAAIEHSVVPFQHSLATVIDIGAHHGQFALLARHRFPDAHVHCFEPQPDALMVLRRLFGNDSQVTIHGVGLGAVENPSQLMHVSHRDDSSSLLPITQQQTSAFPGTSESGLITVPVTRLDAALDAAMIRRPSLLKVDVQGYELDVLRGAGALLTAVDSILVECSFTELYSGQSLAGEVVTWLSDSRFCLAGVFNVTRDHAGRCLQADLLFESTSRRALKPIAAAQRSTSLR